MSKVTLIKGRAYYTDRAKDLYIQILGNVFESSTHYKFKAALIYFSNNQLCETLNLKIRKDIPKKLGWKIWEAEDE